MADQLRWFKVWTSAARDADLCALSLEDFARWVLFGLYVREHGERGRVSLHAPCRGLLDTLRLSTRAPLNARWSALLKMLGRFPNVLVEGDGDAVTVTIVKWAKYQEDTSWERMRRHRQRGKEPRNDDRNDQRNDDRNAVTVQTRRDERDIALTPSAVTASTPIPTPRWPPETFNHDCPPETVPDVHGRPRVLDWRGRCVNAAHWATLDPASRPMLKQCPHHRAEEPAPW